MQVDFDAELDGVDLGDARLNLRAGTIFRSLAASPHVSIAEASEDWAAAKATYRFVRNPDVSHPAILAPHFQRTAERCSEHRVVLAPQDTTSLDFTSRPTMKGLGYTERRDTRGVMVHTTLCLSTEGLPLGLAHQEVWARDLEELGKTKDRAKLALEDKESARWLHSEEALVDLLGGCCRVVCIADREGDIFEWFARPRTEWVDRLIRARHDRCLVNGGKLLTEVAGSLPHLGDIEVEVGRSGERPARTATVSLRAGRVELAAPKKGPARKMKPILVSVVVAEELNPPENTEAIRWVLLASWAVETFEQARETVSWYTQRWKIERFHYMLKSGCQLEKLQPDSVDSLKNTLALRSVSGWRMLWMTYAARSQPETTCESICERYEWESLCIQTSKNPVPPANPPTVREFVRMIAKLGGFLGRKSDGDPGVKVIWRGLIRFVAAAEMYRLMRYPEHGPSEMQTCG